MIDFGFLADDGIVDALLMEIAGLLDRLIELGEAGSIDLRGLPLSPSCIATLEQRLGRGEVAVTLTAAGRSDIHETGFAGVWWTKHADEAGRVIAMLIEVAIVPGILCADIADMRRGLGRLPGSTNFARRAAA
jgi:hydrogenase-1 operon protein HyaF